MHDVRGVYLYYCPFTFAQQLLIISSPPTYFNPWLVALWTSSFQIGP